MPALGDPGADLLVAAERAAQEARHLQAELAGEQRAGRPGGEQFVPPQGADVVAGPVEQVELAVVVGDQRDPLAAAHRQAVVRAARRGGVALGHGAILCARPASPRHNAVTIDRR